MAHRDAAAPQLLGHEVGSDELAQVAQVDRPRRAEAPDATVTEVALACVPYRVVRRPRHPVDGFARTVRLVPSTGAAPARCSAAPRYGPISSAAAAWPHSGGPAAGLNMRSGVGAVPCGDSDALRVCGLSERRVARSPPRPCRPSSGRQHSDCRHDDNVAQMAAGTKMPSCAQSRLAVAFGLHAGSNELYRPGTARIGRAVERSLASLAVHAARRVLRQLEPLLALDIVRIEDGVLHVARPVDAVSRYVAAQAATVAEVGRRPHPHRRRPSRSWPSAGADTPSARLHRRSTATSPGRSTCRP